MANTFKFGNGNWAVKDGFALAYNDENNNFKPLPFDFTRASSATRVNKQGLVEIVGSGKPRIDFLDNTSGHLLLEPSRTNDIQRSEQFDNSYWTKYDTSVSANQVVSPDGAVTADKLIEDTGTSSHMIGRSFSFTSGTTYAVSVFVKENGRDLEIAAGNPNTWRGSAKYNLSTGSVQSTTYGTASIENFGNGWYRCVLVGEAIATSSTNILFKLVSGTNTSYTGDGSSGVYLWGAQRETASYATSYIPTEGSSVTRVAETCNGAGNSTVFNDTESSFFVEIQAFAEESVNRYIVINDGAGSPYTNSLMIQYRNNGTVRIFHNGTDYADAIHISAASFDQTINHKIAVRYKENDMKVYIDGVAQSLNSSFVYQSISGLNELSFDINGALAFLGKIKQAFVFNTALTDTELQNLTS